MKPEDHIRQAWALFAQRTKDLPGMDTPIADLLGWVKRKAVVGKVPRIKRHLAEMFPDGVPDPAFCNRLALRADLLKRDPMLTPLDEDTLKKAIDQYNRSAIKP